MGSMSRSPLAVAQEALMAARRAVPRYSCRFSRRDFTQPQLMALLTLKQFLRMDYRSLIQLVSEWSELRRCLGLKKVPHYSTLHYAQQRLLKKKELRRC
jgi:hypothetical protein